MGITGGQGAQDGHEFRADFAVRSGEERAQLPRRGALRAKPEAMESTGVAALDTFAEGQRALAEAAPAERPAVRRAAGHVSKVRADAARFPAPAARRAERPAIGGPGIDLVGGAAVRAGPANQPGGAVRAPGCLAVRVVARLVVSTDGADGHGWAPARVADSLTLVVVPNRERELAAAAADLVEMRVSLHAVPAQGLPVSCACHHVPSVTATRAVLKPGLVVAAAAAPGVVPSESQRDGALAEGAGRQRDPKSAVRLSVIIRGDAGTYTPEQFEDISLDVPTLLVDTSDGYQPETRESTSFIRAR